MSQFRLEHRYVLSYFGTSCVEFQFTFDLSDDSSHIQFLSEDDIEIVFTSTTGMMHRNEMLARVTFFAPNECYGIMIGEERINSKRSYHRCEIIYHIEALTAIAYYLACMGMKDIDAFIQENHQYLKEDEDFFKSAFTAFERVAHR